LGIRNSAGGWNIRTAMKLKSKQKKTLGKNSYSLLKLDPMLKSDRVYVVEGLFDALALWKMGYRDGDIVVLNGSNVKKLLQDNVLDRYENIYLSLDNDEAGKQFEKAIAEKYMHKNLRKLNYRGKDPNEALQNKSDIKVEQYREQRRVRRKEKGIGLEL
jgi:DNA primase